MAPPAIRRAGRYVPAALTLAILWGLSPLAACLGLLVLLLLVLGYRAPERPNPYLEAEVRYRREWR